MDADAAEVRWCAYAWPVSSGNSGSRCFYVDESGEVFAFANAAGVYSGPGKAPAFDAAFPGDVLGDWASPKPAVAAPYPGRDGGLWKRVN